MSRLLFPILALFIACSAHSQPDAWLTDLSGRSISLSSLKGQWVFINFWAGWCQPCKDEIPELNAFYQKNQHNKVTLFGVNFDSLPVEKQKRLMQALDIRYPALRSNTARSLRLGPIGGVPVTFVYNPAGELAQTLYGPQTVKSLTAIIASQ